MTLIPFIWSTTSKCTLWRFSVSEIGFCALPNSAICLSSFATNHEPHRSDVGLLENNRQPQNFYQKPDSHLSEGQTSSYDMFIWH